MQSAWFDFAGMLTALLRIPPGDRAAPLVARALAHWARVLEVRLYLKPFGADVAILDGYHGLDPDLARSFRAIPLGSPGAVADALALGQPVTRSLEEVDYLTPAFSSLISAATQEPGGRVILDYVPLCLLDESIGLLVLTRVASTTALDSHDQVHLSTTAAALSFWAAERRRDPEVSPASHSEAGISPRQMRILDLMSQGYTNDRVARELGFSLSTVKADLLRLYRLTGTHTRGQLLSAATQMGWLAEDR